MRLFSSICHSQLHQSKICVAWSTLRSRWPPAIKSISIRVKGIKWWLAEAISLGKWKDGQTGSKCCWHGTKKCAGEHYVFIAKRGTHWREKWKCLLIVSKVFDWWQQLTRAIGAPVGFFRQIQIRRKKWSNLESCLISALFPLLESLDGSGALEVRCQIERTYSHCRCWSHGRWSQGPKGEEQEQHSTAHLHLLNSLIRPGTRLLKSRASGQGLGAVMEKAG